MPRRPPYILPLIVIAQFAGTSLWFAGNAIVGDLRSEGNELSVGWITSMVQLGFIAGTLCYAIFSLPDRFNPSKVFFISSLLAAGSNLCVLWFAGSEISTALLRFLTGFFLAGIYPVGMKIASDWYKEGLGKALGFLLGALVLGTAFPHLLKGGYFQFEWKNVVIFTSVLASIGGFLILFFVKDGPYHTHNEENFRISNLSRVFHSVPFRSAVFGYFGHMWELYAFWAFVPLLLAFNSPALDISFWSFMIIAIGTISCIAGGFLSGKIGNAKVAFIALWVSGGCCLFSFLFLELNTALFLSFILLWGFSVIADSPQFSTLVAQNAEPKLKGTSLSIVTSIGFSITIISIALLETIIERKLIPFQWVFTILAIGPILGILGMRKLTANTK